MTAARPLPTRFRRFWGLRTPCQRVVACSRERARDDRCPAADGVTNSTRAPGGGPAGRPAYTRTDRAVRNPFMSGSPGSATFCPRNSGRSTAEDTNMGYSVIVIAVIITALGFDFTNGFHDTANAMATAIATGALKPRVAVVVAGVFNLVG